MRRVRLFTCWFLYLWLVTPISWALDLEIDPLSIEERLNYQVISRTVTEADIEALKSLEEKQTLTVTQLEGYFDTIFLPDRSYGARKDGKNVDWNEIKKDLDDRYDKDISISLLKVRYDQWYREIQTQRNLLTNPKTVTAELETMFESSFDVTTGKLKEGTPSWFGSLKNKVVSSWTDEDWEEFALKKGIPGMGLLLMGLFSLWRKKEERESFSSFTTEEEKLYGSSYKDNMSWTDYYTDTTQRLEQSQSQAEESHLKANGYSDPVVPHIHDVVARYADIPSRDQEQTWLETSGEDLFIQFEEKYKDASPEERKKAFDDIHNQSLHTIGLYSRYNYLAQPADRASNTQKRDLLQKNVGDFIERFQTKYFEEDFEPSYFTRYTPEVKARVKVSFLQNLVKQWKSRGTYYTTSGDVHTGRLAFINQDRRNYLSDLVIATKRKQTLLQGFEERWNLTKQKVSSYWQAIQKHRSLKSTFLVRAQTLRQMIPREAVKQRDKEKILYQETYQDFLSLPLKDRTAILKGEQEYVVPEVDFVTSLNDLFPIAGTEENPVLTHKRKTQIDAYIQKRAQARIQNKFATSLKTLQTGAKAGIPFFQEQLDWAESNEVLLSGIGQLEAQFQTTPWDQAIQHLKQQLARPNGKSWVDKERAMRAINPHLSPTQLMWAKNDWLKYQGKVAVGNNGESLAQHKLSKYIASLYSSRTPNSPIIEETLRRLVYAVDQETKNGQGGYQRWQEYFHQHPLTHQAQEKQLRAQLVVLEQAKKQYQTSLQSQIKNLQAVQQRGVSINRESFIWGQQNSEERSTSWLTKTIVDSQKERSENGAVSASQSSISTARDILTGIRIELGSQLKGIKTQVTTSQTAPFADPLVGDPEATVQKHLKTLNYFGSEAGQAITNQKNEQSWKQEQDRLLEKYKDDPRFVTEKLDALGNPIAGSQQISWYKIRRSEQGKDIGVSISHQSTGNQTPTIKDGVNYGRLATDDERRLEELEKTYKLTGTMLKEAFYDGLDRTKHLPRLTAVARQHGRDSYAYREAVQIHRHYLDNKGYEYGAPNQSLATIQLAPKFNALEEALKREAAEREEQAERARLAEANTPISPVLPAKPLPSFTKERTAEELREAVINIEEVVEREEAEREKEKHINPEDIPLTYENAQTLFPGYNERVEAYFQEWQKTNWYGPVSEEFLRRKFVDSGAFEEWRQAQDTIKGWDWNQANSLEKAHHLADKYEQTDFYNYQRGIINEGLAGLVGILDLLVNVSTWMVETGVKKEEISRTGIKDPLTLVYDLVRNGKNRDEILEIYMQNTEKLRALTVMQNDAQRWGGRSLIFAELFAGVGELKVAGWLSKSRLLFEGKLLLTKVKNFSGKLLDDIDSGATNLWDIVTGNNRRKVVLEAASDGSTVVKYGDDMSTSGGGLGHAITDIAQIKHAIMNTDLRGMKLNDKIVIPDNWTKNKTETGQGFIYKDPDNEFNSIRVVAEDSRSGSGPWFKFLDNNQYKDKYGNIVLKNSTEAHQVLISIN